MPEYRLYSLDRQRLIRNVSTVMDCPDDNQALALGLQRFSAFREVEVWAGSRLVGRLSPNWAEVQHSPPTPMPLERRAADCLRPTSLATRIHLLTERNSRGGNASSGSDRIEEQCST